MSDDLDRRTVLVTGLGMLLGACGVRPSATGPTSSAPSPVSPSAAAPSQGRSPGAAPAVTVLNRAQIVEEFTGRTPAYWGLEAPGVITHLPGRVGTALTLDYCGGPGGSTIDHTVLSALRRYQVPATLFLNARWIEANPQVAEDLAADSLFEIANHGTRHLPLGVSGQSAYGMTGTTGAGEVYDEIMINNAVITELSGRPSRFFRPGTAHLDDVAAEICLALQMVPVGFSVNADAGATYPAQIVTQETARASSGDIIISHGNRPESGTGPGLREAIRLMKDRGEIFLKLSDAIPA